MPTHLIHKSSAEITYQLELVNGKLDQLLKSDVLKDGLAAIVTELAYIKDEIAKSALPNNVKIAIRRIPRRLADISDEIDDCCDCWDDKRDGDRDEFSLADVGADTTAGKALANAGIAKIEDLAGTSAENPEAVAKTLRRKLKRTAKDLKTKGPSKERIRKMVTEAREKLKPT